MNWYIIIDRQDWSFWYLTRHPKRFFQDPTRYCIFGPYNKASARFERYEGGHHV